VLIAGAAVVVGGAAALGVWLLAKDGEGKLRSRQVVLPPVRRPGKIQAQELRRYPPIALVLGDRNRANSTASGDLYTVRADGSGLRRVKAWTDYNAAPDGHVYGTYEARWSPDRRLIALNLSVWEGDPSGQAAVVSPSGRRLRKLSRVSDVGNLAWSSRGELAYTDIDEVRAVSPHTGRTRQIWKPGQQLFGVMRRGGADWAPDGKRLVLETERGLAVVPVAGRKVGWLTHTQRDRDPRWSPSGQRVAFVRVARCYYEFECKAPSNVYVVTPDGSSRRRMTEHAKAASLIWSPDGRSILMTEESPNGLSEGKIAVVGADGRRLRRVASNASALAWSPDGRKILYSHNRALWLMDADGGRPTRLLPIGHGRGLALVAADWGVRPRSS
jgi:dipeptidyl aminopeptidase/acylaminoacyl peptidase